LWLSESFWHLPVFTLSRHPMRFKVLSFVDV
jgi:hypothetical protein